MTRLRKLRVSTQLLSAMSYLIIGGVAIPLLATYFSDPLLLRWLAMALLAAFTGMTILRDLGKFDTPVKRYVYIIIQTFLVMALGIAPPGVPFAVILFFMLSAEATLFFPQRISIAWLGLFSIATLIVLVASEGPKGIIILPIYIGGYFFFAAFAMQTAQAEAARQHSETLLAQLQIAHQQLQKYAAQAEALAVSEERNRLAREVHDTLGHRLTVSAVQLQAAQRLIRPDPERAAQLIDTVREQIREALNDLRSTVATLRAPLEVDLALSRSLVSLCDSFQQATGIAIHLELPDPLPDLPEAHRLTLYRAAQEGLTNIQKHAGASQAWLRLSQQDGLIRLDVEDNGRGISSAGDAEKAAAGFGLHGLRERTGHLGGSLALQPRPGGGTRLAMTLPLAEETQDV